MRRSSEKVGTMHIEDIEYFSDDQRFVGQLAVDDSRDGARPAVLVSHEGGGLDDHAKNVARRLAELGYTAFALDYFGDGKPPPPDERMERFTRLAGDPSSIRRVGGAGLEVLLASNYTDASRVAAIGFCFGGTMSLELARSGADLKAVVGFHSGLSTNEPAGPSAIKGSVLVCIGADDPWIPPEQRVAFEEEMRGAGADWRMNVYGGAVHSFTNPKADSSNPGARLRRPRRCEVMARHARSLRRDAAIERSAE